VWATAWQQGKPHMPSWCIPYLQVPICLHLTRHTPRRLTTHPQITNGRWACWEHGLGATPQHPLPVLGCASLHTHTVFRQFNPSLLTHLLTFTHTLNTHSTLSSHTTPHFLHLPTLKGSLTTFLNFLQAHGEGHHTFTTASLSWDLAPRADLPPLTTSATDLRT